jgi:hypothetical protein
MIILKLLSAPLALLAESVLAANFNTGTAGDRSQHQVVLVQSVFDELC